MVIPVGGPSSGGVNDVLLGEASEVPRVVREKYVYGWYVLFALWVVLAILRIVISDIIGAVMCGIMAYFVQFMVRQDCAKMSQYCLFLMGFISSLNCTLEFIQLASVASGRVRQSEVVNSNGEAGSTTYTVSFEKDPLFDGALGPLYNMQSAVMVVSPICWLISFVLSYFSYNAYSTFLFDDGPEAPLVPPASRTANARDGYGGAGRYAGSAQRLGGGINSGPRIFEGAGQRLGD
eukprot:TRINITY_DN63579_c0_g1_i1.p1 TRINITY_DN63579_c0_g1~~TRINITY_DN63579_c0_g1_i1.p1  ORF type:complete len:235 (+),score=41.82 TRINITY_DN63579_c0_g1_i1:92-796(+)